MTRGSQQPFHWQPFRPATLVMLVALAMLAAGVALLASVFDWNWFRGPISRGLSATTGRHFEIRGDLDVDLGRITRIEATDVFVGNAPWASSPHLARADVVRIQLAVRPLLSRRVQVPLVELHGPVLWLERDDRGESNWRFRTPPGSRPQRALMGRPQVGELVVRNGKVRYRDSGSRIDLVAGVNSAPRGAEDAFAPLVVAGAGRYRDGRIALNGRVDSPLESVQAGRGPRIDLAGRAGETTARLHGRLGVPIDAEHFELHLAVKGPDLAELQPLLRFAVPRSPPYSLRGRLHRDGDTYGYRDLRGTIGDSDVEGDVSVRHDGRRPYVRAELVSRSLDLDDLAVLVGAPPAVGAGETANAEQAVEAIERAADPRVLPDRPYDLGKLRSVNADVLFRATEVRWERVPVEAVDARFVLRDGRAEFQLHEVTLADGKVRGTILLDARHDPIATTVDLRASGVELPRLFPRLRARTDRQTSVGKMGGIARFESQGNSVAQMLATADGEVSTVMGAGRVSNLLLERAGLDVAESIKYTLGRDRTVKLRCAYADFAIEEGIARSRTMAFDTADTLILGQGSIDLRAEKFDLMLRPRPKDMSPVSLRGPLEMRGTFKDPSIRPQPGPLVARLTAAAALFAAAPPAALLALVETGPGENIDCGPARREAPARLSSQVTADLALR